MKKEIFKYIYLGCFALIIVSLPFSKFTLSISEFLLLITWFAEGNLISKLKKFLQNKIAVVIASVYLLHLIGLIYTSDFDYAFNDLKTKLPLLAFPVIFSSIEPIEKKWFERLMYLFIVAVFTSTIISVFVLLGFSKHEITDIRQISIYTSHIRLSLMICISVFSLFYFIISSFKSLGFWLTALQIIFVLWFVSFLILLESVTGLAIIIIVSLFLAAYFIWKAKRVIYRIILFSLLVLIPFFISVYLIEQIGSYYAWNIINLDMPLQKTRLGNSYSSDLNNPQMENGHYVWRNICYKELDSAWNKRSKINFEKVKYTVIRFLTSKGLTKDAMSINSLSENEIKYIEKGIANIEYTKPFSIKSRLYKFLAEYDNYKQTKNPSGYSAIMRYEFWKTSLRIIKKNILFGTGTGDVNNAFKNEYKEMNTKLSQRWQFHSHNQFLAITVASGVFGLIWFLFSLFYPLFKLKKFDYFYITFFLIVFISMLAEDTLETQVGVTLFAFFNSFFIFIKPKK
ncbi:MAG: O-antigen ligase family protein [Bacteroidales bacterium]|nr:O-antigen ligase family protein [Bacteroidales bacterium]